MNIMNTQFLKGNLVLFALHHDRLTLTLLNELFYKLFHFHENGKEKGFLKPHMNLLRLKNALSSFSNL